MYNGKINDDEKINLFCFKHLNKFFVLSCEPISFYSSVVIWNLATKEAVCGAPAAVLSAGTTYCVAFAHNDNNLFITGGK